DVVTLTCRSRLSLISYIRDLIRDTPRQQLVRDTCFGWLLDIDEAQENGLLIHFMSCCEVESVDSDTNIVPLPYQVGDYEIQFGREEFCLVTGLRFGVEFSSRYAIGKIPFRRRVFESSMDGKPITTLMVLENINSETFNTIHDLDVVRLCLLAMLQLVLLGLEPKYVVPDWCLRLVVDIDERNKYPWGSYIWPSLWKQLRNTNVRRWKAFYGTPRNLVSSRAFFDGLINEPPPTPLPVHQDSRDHDPEDIYRRMEEPDRMLKDLQKQMNQFLQGNQIPMKPQAKKGPIDVGQHYGLSDFSCFQNTHGFPRDGPTMAPMQSNNSCHPASNPATPYNMTPMAQQGFAQWSSTYQTTVDRRPQCDPSHNRDVVGVIPSPYMALPDPTVAPNKPDDNCRNKTRKAKVSTFNLGKVGVDVNARFNDVMITGARATENYLLYYYVDPNKVVRGDYPDCDSFIFKPQPVFLDCHIRGSRVEGQFW
ncbi:phospholipase-like protein, partial [Tanacetum coccineum]